MPKSAGVEIPSEKPSPINEQLRLPKMQTQLSKWHSISKMKSTFDQQAHLPVGSPVAYIERP